MQVLVSRKVFAPIKGSYRLCSSNPEWNWVCGLCSLPQITAKCYQQSSYADLDSSSSDDQDDIWHEYDAAARKHPTNVKIGHINVNHIAGFKFHEIKSWLLDGFWSYLKPRLTQLSLTLGLISRGSEY